jgi:hypothetical protein
MAALTDTAVKSLKQGGPQCKRRDTLFQEWLSRSSIRQYAILPAIVGVISAVVGDNTNNGKQMAEMLHADQNAVIGNG